MKKHTQLVAITVLLGLASLLVLTGFSDANAEQRGNMGRSPENQEVDPYDGKEVLVEAFVVEADADQVASLKVDPFSAKPESITAGHLLEMIKNKKARISTGAKLAMKHRNSASMNSRKVIYYKREIHLQTKEGPQKTQRVNYENYSQGITFETRAALSDADRVEVSFEFNQVMVDTENIIEDIPFSTGSRRWNNSVSLKDGQPAIVGAVEDSGKSVFLVLTANIQD